MPLPTANCSGLGLSGRMTPLPETTLRDPGSVPPTVTDPAKILTPLTWLPWVEIPSASRPMKLPAIEIAPPPDTDTPESRLPVITLRAPVAVPPIVVLWAPVSTSMPLEFPIRFAQPIAPQAYLTVPVASVPMKFP